MTETVAGPTDFVFGAYFAVVDFVRDGKLKPIAVAAKERWKSLPDVPTLPELGIHNVEFDTWSASSDRRRCPGHRHAPERRNPQCDRSIDMVKALDNFRSTLAGSPEKLGNSS